MACSRVNFTFAFTIMGFWKSTRLKGTYMCGIFKNVTVMCLHIVQKIKLLQYKNKLRTNFENEILLLCNSILVLKSTLLSREIKFIAYFQVFGIT